MTAVVGTVSSTTGTTGWTNPNNIFTSNNVYAVSSSTASSTVTGFIFALGNGFSIPSTATIDGVAVAIEAKNALSGNGFRLRGTSGESLLVESGASVGSDTGVVTWTTTSDATFTVGGATNTWGGGLTPAIINSSTFGFKGRFFNLNASAQTFSIDSIIITVYYTDGGVSGSRQQFFMYEF